MYDFLDEFFEEEIIKRILDSKAWHEDMFYQFIEQMTLGRDIQMYFDDSDTFNIEWKKVITSPGDTFRMTVQRIYLVFKKDEVKIQTADSQKWEDNVSVNSLKIRYDSTEEYLFQLSTIYDTRGLSVQDLERFVRIRDIYVG